MDTQLSIHNIPHHTFDVSSWQQSNIVSINAWCLEQGMNGIDVESFKLGLILYADDMVIFANNAAEL